MLRSLYAAVSGVKGHQTLLDVTGNNIANVNTPASRNPSSTSRI
jgi:flagellar hook protein FlgE